MAVTTVWQASDGKLFKVQADAVAYENAYQRRLRIIAHFKTHPPLRDDVGHLLDSPNLQDIVDCLVKDATILRTVVLV